jgi:hypothetical protein
MINHMRPHERNDCAVPRRRPVAISISKALKVARPRLPAMKDWITGTSDLKP